MLRLHRIPPRYLPAHPTRPRRARQNGTVPTGKGDPGGVSYGLYQMTSKNHETGEIGGTVKQYVESDSFPWKKEFEGLEPGSEEFSAR